MSSEPAALTGPDLEKDGISLTAIASGKPVTGHAGGEPVLVVRVGEETFAIGAKCTHYGGPLGEGLVAGDQVRCPWHHACFDLRTGEASAGPALSPVACFDVEQRGKKLFVIGKKKEPKKDAPKGKQKVVVIGGGAAGFAAIEMLRRCGHDGPITLVSADDAAPYDRPNASKDYLAGTAPEEWMPLRGGEFYTKERVDLKLSTRVTGIDVAAKRVHLQDGKQLPYDALLLATGADPVRLDVPGSDLPHVHTLRSLTDSRTIIAAAKTAKRVVVMGASFIGLEVAASLKTRGLEVHVVAPDAQPLSRVLGNDIGAAIQRIHESHGVVFHLGRKARSIDAAAVTLDDDSRIEADLIVAGIGVRPSTALAEKAGIKTERGIVVDASLHTSGANVWAAGDVARYPDSRWLAADGTVRIEHWVVAERQGQTAARNIIATFRGTPPEAFRDVPFFWTNHYDRALAYVGHAESWDTIDIDGKLDKGDFAAAFRRAGRTIAVATMGRDRTSLEAELALERGDEPALAKLIPAR